MPLSKKGKKIMKEMQKQYGKKRGTSVLDKTPGRPTGMYNY